MFDLGKIYTDFISWVLVTVIGGCAGWVIALRRKVNTNEKQIAQDRLAHAAQIEIIMADLRSRDKLRDEDRARMDRVQVDVREMRGDLSELKNALIGKG